MTLVELQQLTGITPTEGNRYGSRFELNPIQHSYDIQFARSMAAISKSRGQKINILDFGCGNGDMATGMIKKMFEAGYEGQLGYAGVDLDPTGISSAKETIAKSNPIQSNDRIVVAGLEVADLRDTEVLDKVLLRNLPEEQLNVFLFGNSLQWLKPDDIHNLLS